MASQDIPTGVILRTSRSEILRVGPVGPTPAASESSCLMVIMSPSHRIRGRHEQNASDLTTGHIHCPNQLRPAGGKGGPALNDRAHMVIPHPFRALYIWANCVNEGLEPTVG